MTDDPERGRMTPPPPGLDDDGFPALTEEEEMAYERLKAAFGGWLPDATPCLMRIRHEDRPRAVIALVEQHKEDVTVWPLALLLDDDLFDRLTPCAEPDEVVTTDDGNY